MESDFSSNDDDVGVHGQSTKKRKTFGRMKSVMKKLRLASHETGNDCLCKRLKCFENVSAAERGRIIKKSYRKKCRKFDTMEAIAMDFQKNLHTPNITTNDVYYKRQLNFYSFNIHVLATNESLFYTYDESVARKGADDVCSMLNHFVNNHLPQTVRELIIFCDSCGGQNKNYTVIRFLHHQVTEKRRFECVKMIFPIRGHSYMECDKNMSLINQKSIVELPDEWREVIRNSRLKPSPFHVVDCDTTFFKSWTTFLNPVYKEKCPFPTRAIRSLKIMSNSPKMVHYRNTYCGYYTQANVMWQPFTKGKNKGKPQPPGVQLQNAYDGRLPISSAKYNDLQHLTRFLNNSEAKIFYKTIPTSSVIQHENQEDIFLDYLQDDE